MKTLDKLYTRAARRVPGGLAGRVDLLRPSLRSVWGGPLNGQQYRCAMVREIACKFKVDHVVETGTFRGTGAEFFAAVFGAPVTTVEASSRFFTYSSRLLAYNSSIVVVAADSRDYLRKAATGGKGASQNLFFYLDAHWEKDLPLREELEIIAGTWRRAIVMIDDFQVPGDPGYGFDNYGDGNALKESYLPSDALRGWTLFYPAAPSTSETGARRGSCVLMGQELSPVGEQFTTLKAAGTL